VGVLIDSFLFLCEWEAFFEHDALRAKNQSQRPGGVPQTRVGKRVYGKSKVKTVGFAYTRQGDNPSGPLLLKSKPLNTQAFALPKFRNS